MKEPRINLALIVSRKCSNSVTTNMVLINHEGSHKYNSPEEIMDEFFDVRMEYYKRRKVYLYKKN